MLKLGAPDDVLVNGLRTRQILTQSNHWSFLGWDHNAKCLKPTKQEPLSSTHLDEMLTRVLQLTLQPEMIQKFSAMKPLPKDSIPDNHLVSVPWRLDLSMGGQESTELHQLLSQLSGNGPTDCHAASINRSSMEPSCQCNSTEIEEMISHLSQQIWVNPCNMCYILSVLRAQL